MTGTHLPPLYDEETAGRALLIAAASAAALAGSEEEIPAAVVVNILGFAAARMVADGRARLGAQGVTPLCGPT